MKRKAIFLLVTFLLNTLIGFGCALGMDLKPHDENHSHPESTHSEHNHQLTDGHVHKTASVVGEHFSKEEPCCKTLVNDLAIQSKLVPEASKVPIVMPIAGLSKYTCSLFIAMSAVDLDQSSYVPFRERPPDKDIRIAIQSFQI